MRNAREGLVVMALGVVVFVLGGLVAQGTAIRWIGAGIAIAGFVTWQWHARRDLRERQED